LPLVLLSYLALVASSCGAGEPHEGAFRWRIATEFEVDAPPSRVWDVIADLPAYREWNPFIVDASGTLAAGETLSLRMALPDRSPILISPRVLVADAKRELRWKGRLLVPGLFDGEHWFRLTPLEDGRTLVDHSEDFSGILLPLGRRLVYEDTVRAFHALNAALAARAEGAAP
jgi:hypothetical protein